MDSLVLERQVAHISLEINGDPAILEPLFHIGYRCKIFDDRECSFPNISSSCLMNDFGKAKNLFKSRAPYQKGGYMDVHCELGTPPVAIAELMDGWGLNGKIVRWEGDESGELFKVEGADRFAIAQQYFSRYNATAISLSFGKFFMYRLRNPV